MFKNILIIIKVFFYVRRSSVATSFGQALVAGADIPRRQPGHHRRLLS
jgi:hypothetical protein